MAILQSIRMWQPYLIGQKFFIQTNQKSLKYLLEQKIGTPEQQNWVAKLLRYENEIIYRSGKSNVVADALSRRAHISQSEEIQLQPAIQALTSTQTPVWSQIAEEGKSDPYMQKVAKMVINNPEGPYSMRHGLILFKNRVIVPPSSSLISQLL